MCSTSPRTRSCTTTGSSVRVLEELEDETNDLWQQRLQANDRLIPLEREVDEHYLRLAEEVLHPDVTDAMRGELTRLDRQIDATRQRWEETQDMWDADE